MPTKVENLGIEFTIGERSALLWVFIGVVAYYTVVFIIYAMGDFLSFRRAVHLGRQEIRRRRAARQDDGFAASLPSEGLPVNARRSGPQDDDEASWRMIGLVSPVSGLREVFDFAVPILVALCAMVALYTATHQAVQPKAPPPAIDGL